jgi:hypothetical protein
MHLCLLPLLYFLLHSNHTRIPVSESTSFSGPRLSLKNYRLGTYYHDRIQVWFKLIISCREASTAYIKMNGHSVQWMKENGGE